MTQSRPDDVLDRGHDNGHGFLARIGATDTGPLAVIAGIVIIWAIFTALNGNFLTVRNISNLTLQMGATGIIAIGAVFVFIAGEIDLSLGSITGASAALLGVLLTEQSWPAWAAIAVTLGFALCAGLLQGLIAVVVGVPSFIVTLGGFLAFFGLQLALMGSAGELGIADPAVLAIANDYFGTTASWILTAIAIAAHTTVSLARQRSWRAAGLAARPSWRTAAGIIVPSLCLIALVAYLNAYLGVPYLLAVLLCLVVGLGWISRRTIYGAHLYAVGGNREAARRAGVNVAAIRVSALGLSGLLAGLAGIVIASRLYAVSANIGGGTLLLEAIAAAIIGGTSLFGGRGRTYHALLGALVIVSIENGLDLLGQTAAAKNIATGIVLVLAVCIDAINRRRRHQAG